MRELLNPQRAFCSWKELIGTKSLWFSLLGWARAQSTFFNTAQKQLPGCVTNQYSEITHELKAEENYASTTWEKKNNSQP